MSFTANTRGSHTGREGDFKLDSSSPPKDDTYNSKRLKNQQRIALVLKVQKFLYHVSHNTCADEKR